MRIPSYAPNLLMRREIVFGRLEQLGLGHALQYVLKNNPSAHLPYHSTTHCLTVADGCMTLADMEGVEGKDKKILALAGLFHDFNHSGGQLADVQNIERAIVGLNEFAEETREEWDELDHKQSMKDIEPLTADHYDRKALATQKYISISDAYEAGELIQVTEWTGVFPHDPVGIQQEILRDADLLQLFEPNCARVALIGLRTEIAKGGPLMDLQEFLIKQVEFIRGVHFYTASANRITKYARQELIMMYEQILADVQAGKEVDL
jgi:hypothetical protein